MFRATWVAVVVIACSGNAYAQCNCGYPHSCTTPCARCAESCTREVGPPKPEPPSQEQSQERGAFAAPPRTGTTSGESRALGIEGLGIHVPAMSIRLPTITLPTFVRHRREARLMADAQEAPYVRDTMRERTLPQGNDGELTERSLRSGERDAQSSERGLPCDRAVPAGERSAPPGCVSPGGVDPQGSAMGPLPPTPRAVRAVAHPDLGALPQGQYLQDPATGRVYQVVLQPMAVAQQPVEYAQVSAPHPYAVPATYAAAQSQAPVAVTTLPNSYPAPASYPTTAASDAPVVQPLPAVESYPAAGGASWSTAGGPGALREAELSQALDATQQRAEELENQVRRLEGLVDRLARQRMEEQATLSARHSPAGATDAATQMPQRLPSPDATPVALENATPAPSVGGKIRSWFVRK